MNINNSGLHLSNLNSSMNTQSRLSVSTEKFQLSNNSSTSYLASANTCSASTLELKSKGQTDNYLGISFLDLTRSCSNSTNDLNRSELRKTSVINSSRLNGQ
jgi:hypothetical protein